MSYEKGGTFEDKTGGPAFPAQPTHHLSGSISITSHHGMTLRDYFAAMAMQGMFAADTLESVIRTETKAKLAYEMADAMLAGRDK